MSKEKIINKQKTVNSVSKPVSNKKFPDILGGMVLITVGSILLLNSFDVIPWTIWSYIFFFWPVIFIFIGLDIISGNSLFYKTLTTLIGLGIIVFIICYGLTATDLRVRNYLYRYFPIWKQIYQSIPQKSTLDLNEMFRETPDEFRWERRGNSWN